MGTRSAVTNAKRKQPVRGRLLHRDSIFEKDDATFAAFCLNACMGTAAYERLTALHRDLLQFWAETLEQQRQQRTRPGFLDLRLLGALDKRHLEISERLARYVFRPGIAYTAVGGECRSGVVSIHRRNVAEIRKGTVPITEADCALALVRLHAIGDLSKVRLCETCRKRWRVAAHSNYRFCSKECREQFYKSEPDYHQRKAKNQSRYRALEKLKRMRAAQDVALKGRKEGRQ